MSRPMITIKNGPYRNYVVRFGGEKIFEMDRETDGWAGIDRLISLISAISQAANFRVEIVDEGENDYHPVDEE